jgi:hypothetical protein
MTKKNYTLISIFLVLSVLITFTSCDDPGDVGMDLLPSSDLISVASTQKKEGIRAYTFTDDSVRTDEATPSLLGSLNDPVFGNTTIDLALQLRLTSFPSFGVDPVLDSVIFFFYYTSVYGDTSTVQNIKVYELISSIDPDVSYYDNYDLSQHASTIPLADFDFKPKVTLDSVYQDTLYQLVGIKLDNSIGQKLLSADSLDMINNEAFLEYFKGLYLQTEPVSTGGAIVSLDLIPTSSFQGSALALYYRNDTTKNLKTYFITNFSARVNSFKHNYTGTPFYANLNKETTIDSLIYIQSTGGLKSKLIIPGIETWKDSTRVAINKAEVIFQVDTTASDFRKYPLPSQLLLTYVDNNGRETMPRDHSFYPAYYGGFLMSDYTYRFNITQHMQSIIDGQNNNNGFYLTPLYKNNEMRRAVLKGAGSAQGIRFNVTYSKIMQ